MLLSAGTRLGPYEIVAPIGAGGMGEVYRARDTRLDRTVAIKVVLELGGADANRRARFEREARIVASLDHPGAHARCRQDRSPHLHVTRQAPRTRLSRSTSW
jgi:serine/threonine protein kinase